MNAKSYYINVTLALTMVINLRDNWCQRAGFVLLHSSIFLHLHFLRMYFQFDLSSAILSVYFSDIEALEACFRFLYVM